MFRNWNRTELSWAFYDWANSVYPLIVITAFFPEILGYHIEDSGTPYNKTTLIGYATSAAGLVVVFLAPVLGALGDQYGARRKLLAAFAALGILATFSLSLVELGRPLLAILVFAFGNIGFSTANGLYDSLIVSVTRREKMDRLSGLGFSLGYAGSLLLFLFGYLSAKYPGAFGLPDTTAAIRMIFVLAAIWWLLFMIPLLTAAIDEKPLAKPGVNAWRHIAAAFVELRETYHEIRRYRDAAIFLLAYWLYIDAILTVISMAQPYASALGFERNVPLVGILIVQVIAIPSTLAYVRLAGRYGLRRMIMLGVVAYLAIISLAPFMYLPEHFYALAVVVGLAQGGIQSLSRTFFARLIPHSEAGKYFGFYNMVGKFAQLLGPFLMGYFAQVANQRYSILALPPLLIIGLILLAMVDDSDDDSDDR